jgi:RNA 3'-terminal phosphate cyclase (ATP)
MATLVRIDGSYGEGGGQIIRTALSLSAMTGRPLEIENVRAGRSKPGLQRQHLTAVHAAAALCDAEVTGAAVGSTYFRFEPRGEPVPRPYRFEIGTAGAAPLVIQTTLLPLACAGTASSVTVVGGTHVPHAPPADYLESVYLPALRPVGLNAALSYPRAGFYPRGGGEIVLDVEPSGPLKALDLTGRGKLVSLTAYIVTAELPDHVSERGAAAVERFMKGIGRPVTVVPRKLSSAGAGAAVVLAVECEGGFAGFSAIGEPGKPMERVAEEPCGEFLEWWKTGAACDEHLADQLVLPMALAKGESRWTTSEVTEHLRTVLWLTRQFLPIRYDLEERDDGTGTVTLHPAG